MTPPAFAHRIVTREEDIDDLGHVNNVNYLRWMLEAASEHWRWYRASDRDGVGTEVGWVVIRHELDYFQPAFLGDTIEVVTWVPTVTALTCDRYYEVVRLRDGALLARGASTYCVVDRATGKPRRMGEQLRQLLGAPEIVPRTRAERLFPERPAEIRRAIPVR